MGLFRRRKGVPYAEEEDRVEFRTDLPLKLRFLWIDLKHGLSSRRPFRTLRVKLQEWSAARAEKRQLRELGLEPRRER